ncbi:MAG: MFS transporter [Thermomicrobiales bacterium]
MTQREESSTALIRESEQSEVPPANPVSRTAWVMVIVIATTMTIANGARFLFGVVLKPLTEEFGWNRAELTAAVLIAMIILSVCQPFIGILVDRYGPKRILVTGVLLLGLALVPLSYATQLWQIYLFYGVFTSLGLAAASPVTATALIGRWFQAKRGLAMSLATSGSAFGQLVIVPVATWILTMSSWQMTYRVMAVAVLVVAVPLSIAFLQNAPKPVDGMHAGGWLEDDGATLREALLHPAFWLLALGFAVCGWTMAFPNTHFLAYADDMGMSLLHAAHTVSVTAVFSIVGSVLLGVAADRYPRTWVLALTYALRGLAFLLLLLLPMGNLIYIYGVVLGISWTATTPITAAIAADRYGPRNLGVIFGCMFTFMNLGFGVGAFLDGVIYEWSGGYTAALLINVALGLVAAAGIILVPFTGKERVARPRTVPVQPQRVPASAAD